MYTICYDKMLIDDIGIDSNVDLERIEALRDES